MFILLFLFCYRRRGRPYQPFQWKASFLLYNSPSFIFLFLLLLHLFFYFLFVILFLSSCSFLICDSSSMTAVIVLRIFWIIFIINWRLKKLCLKHPLGNPDDSLPRTIIILHGVSQRRWCCRYESCYQRPSCTKYILCQIYIGLCTYSLHVRRSEFVFHFHADQVSKFTALHYFKIYPFQLSLLTQWSLLSKLFFPGMITVFTF